MKHLHRDRAASFLWAAVVDVAIVGSVLIIHELNPALRSFLNRLTGHHWVTMSLVTCVLFPGLALLLYRTVCPVSVTGRLRTLATVLSAVTVLFYVGTVALFVWEYLK